MKASLDACWRRLAKAKGQLDELDAAVGQFLAGEPYEIITELRGDGRFASCFRVLRQPDPDWTEDAGTITYKVRTALDHLVEQLALGSAQTFVDSSG